MCHSTLVVVDLFAGGGNASDLLPFAAAEQVVVVPGAVLSVAHLQAAELQLRQREQQQRQTADGPSLGRVPAPDQLTAVVAGDVPPCPHFRLSFASVQSDDALLEGFVRLKRAIMEFQQHRASAATS
jgi:hypothetical protein